MHYTGTIWRPPYEATSTLLEVREKERIQELQKFINHLNIQTHLLANTVSNYAPLTAYLPYDREKATNELQYILAHADEPKMLEYRKNLKSLG